MKSIIILAAGAILFIMGCAQYIETDSQIILPRVKELPVLIYPHEAQQNNWTGISIVEIFISKTGSVVDTRVINSSGYAVLDEAARKYCEKIIFDPATASGNAINSRSVFKVKFALSNQEAFEKSYISKINELYSKVLDASELERYDFQKEIFNKHKEFFGNLQDVRNCNSIILKVISQELGDQWKAYMKYCPLTFLVYHDFMQRFPDFTNLTEVKGELKKNVMQNLKSILQLPVSAFDNPAEKENFMNYIKSFVQKNYPEINIQIDNGQVINS